MTGSHKKMLLVHEVEDLLFDLLWKQNFSIQNDTWSWNIVKNMDILNGNWTYKALKLITDKVKNNIVLLRCSVLPGYCPAQLYNWRQVVLMLALL